MVTRRVLSVAAFLSVAAVSVVFILFLGCMDGTTPNCAPPDAGCGAVADGNIVIDANGNGDAAMEASSEAAGDSPAPDSSPVDSAPVDSAPVDSAPADSAPADAPTG